MYRSWMTKKNGCLKMKWEAMQMKSNLMKNKSPLMHNNLSPNTDEPPLTFRSPSPPNKKTDPIEGRFPLTQSIQECLPQASAASLSAYHQSGRTVAC